MKCISDIKSREWVVPAMNYLVRILQNCLQSSSKLGKNILRVCAKLLNFLIAILFMETYKFEAFCAL